MRVVQILEEVLNARRINKEPPIRILKLTNREQSDQAGSTVSKVGKELRCHREMTVPE